MPKLTDTPYLREIKVFDKKVLNTFELTCITCLSKREVSYFQALNVFKNKSSGNCQSCAEKQKDKQPKIEKPLKPKLSDVLKYRNLFNNPAKNVLARQKMSQAKLGKTENLTNNWRGGKTKERILLMSRQEYKDLRTKVFIRDNFTCVSCSSKGGKLQMDHIKEWSNYPELRFDENNCRTLCINCHKKTDNYGVKAIKGKSNAHSL